MVDRAVIISILLVGFWGIAWSDELVLICDYPSLPASSQKSPEVVPRELTIDLDDSTVTWDGLDVDVPAEITERFIEFHRDGYDYLVSRLTGHIRFSNPSELARWSDYVKSTAQAAALRGQSTEKAIMEANKRLETELSAREQVGECSPTSKPKF